MDLAQPNFIQFNSLLTFGVTCFYMIVLPFCSMCCEVFKLMPTENKWSLKGRTPAFSFLIDSRRIWFQFSSKWLVFNFCFQYFMVILDQLLPTFDLYEL